MNENLTFSSRVAGAASGEGREAWALRGRSLLRLSHCGQKPALPQGRFRGREGVLAIIRVSSADVFTREDSVFGLKKH